MPEPGFARAFALVGILGTVLLGTASACAAEPPEPSSPATTTEEAPPGHGHAQAPAAAVPLFDDLGTYHRAITTSVPAAQQYFDQGLRLMYAFNLEEAERSFREAARRDPECASCFWGVAMALGPHINFPAQAERTKAAHQSVAAARRAAGRATPVEAALIEALAHRYSDPPPADAAGQKRLDEAYAVALREVAGRFPDDLDVAALAAEALLDLRPWDLWTLDGKPQPGTEEILSILERVLARDPQHPGANHYYIHATEASPHPERALASAERMPGLIPGAAHLVHMPSHVYMRVGRYADAVEANRRAIRADEAYLARSPDALAGFYSMYFGHNYQFLWAAALMEGRGEESLAAGRKLLEMVPAEMLAQMPGLDFGLGFPWWTLVRQRRWDDMLREPAPPPGFPYAQAIWHTARGLALTGKSDPDAAGRELAAVRSESAKVPEDALEGLNSARALLRIASDLLAGEIAAARGQVEEARKHLQAAVAAEDVLRYNEPPDWYSPVRHFLGEALLQANRPAEAAAVYEEDLKRNPENGWALAGLAESLRRQGKATEAAAVQKRFEKAWSRADLEPLPAPPS